MFVWEARAKLLKLKVKVLGLGARASDGSHKSYRSSF